MRLFLSQHEDGNVGKGVIGDEEEREHGDDAFEGAEDEEHGGDGTEKEREFGRAAFVYARDAAEEQAVRAHGVEDARAEELDGIYAT